MLTHSRTSRTRFLQTTSNIAASLLIAIFLKLISTYAIREKCYLVRFSKVCFDCIYHQHWCSTWAVAFFHTFKISFNLLTKGYGGHHPSSKIAYNISLIISLSTLKERNSKGEYNILMNRDSVLTVLTSFHLNWGVEVTSIWFLWSKSWI